jgi:ketosteroid isomerase-like protein
MKTSINFLIKGLLMIFITLALTECQPKKTANVTEKDKTTITEWNAKCLTMAKNLNKDNAEAYVNYTYSEDAILFPPNAKSIKGREAITVFYQNYPPMSDFNQEIEEMEVLGDYAYLRLNWSIPVAQTELNPSYIETGKIFCVMRKQIDGNWKIWREIWNSDISAPTTPTVNPDKTK